MQLTMCRTYRRVFYNLLLTVALPRLCFHFLSSLSSMTVTQSVMEPTMALAVGQLGKKWGGVVYPADVIVSSCLLYILDRCPNVWLIATII